MRKRAVFFGSITKFLLRSKMTRSRLLNSFFGIIGLLGLACANDSGSKALVVQSEKNFQVQEERFGLLEHAGGRCQLINVGNPLSITPRPGTQRKIKHLKASLLTASLFGLIVRNLFWLDSTTRGDWIGFTILYLLYLLEASTCSTRRYLSNMKSPAEVKVMVENLQHVAPRIRWNIECYHYEDDYRHDSRSRRHDTNTKRVTYRASELYDFQHWNDVTRVQEAIGLLESGNASYLKITLLKLVTFINSMSYQEYLAQHSRFVARHGHRDRYTDTWTSIEVDGYTPKILAVRTVLGTEAHVRLPMFWICTLLGLTIPYRFHFSSSCDELDLVLSKEIAG